MKSGLSGVQVGLKPDLRGESSVFRINNRAAGTAP